MTGPEHNELAILNARLFGLDGSGELGAFGQLSDRITALEHRVARWDGAIQLVRVGAGILGFGGIAFLLRAIVAA